MITSKWNIRVYNFKYKYFGGVKELYFLIKYFKTSILNKLSTKKQIQTKKKQKEIH